MREQLRIEMLPAAHGDALWIEYGNPAKPRRILIDAGPAHTYDALRARILALPPGERKFELFVVTHIDCDHIDGAILLLRDPTLGVEFGDVWFNGVPQLREVATFLGVEQGEFLGALLNDPGRPWNRATDGGVLIVPDPDAGGLPEFKLHDGGPKLTLLSPDRGKLLALAAEWNSEVRSGGYEAGDTAAALERLEKRREYREPPPLLGSEDFGRDSSRANGSSVAFLFEYGDKRLLLSGDAHANVLEASIRRWRAKNRNRKLALDAFKIPHHGSRSNVSETLYTHVNCKNYLVSTNGDRFGHPHEDALLAIAEAQPGRRRAHFWFNYKSATTAAFEDPDAQREGGYVAHYPSGLQFEV